jgi:DNA-binding NarL/FixJ family response regulator
MTHSRTLPLNILLVDDDAFNREGVCLFLRREHFEVLEAGDEQSALALAATETLHAAVIDISIPPDPSMPSRVQHSFGIDLARRLKQANPMLGVVLFSAYEDRGSEVLNMVRAGTRGLAYKLKGCPPKALLEAINDVRLGRVVIDPEVTNPRSLADEFMARLTPEEQPWVEGIIAQFNQLSPRETEVTYRLAAAYSIDGIANALNVAPRTIEHHIGRIHAKLGLRELPPHLQRSVLLAKACMIIDLRTGEWRW